uniref:Methyltransf_21 domain-containing protein n=1 Tax=Caenorhabditis japonica TaxID=281687 RepID=A0A8R1I6L7_CAEJA
MTKELRMLRLAFLKWRTCMRDELDDQQLSLEDMDPEDPQFSYLEWMVRQSEKEKLKEDSDEGEKFGTLWHKLGSYADKCRSKTDMWHMEPDTVPGTALKYFLPSPIDTPVTFVRVGIGANVSIEKHFKKHLSADSEFFGADPVYVENSQVYEPIGTFFPFAVGNETGVKQATLKYSSDRVSAKLVNHIGISTFFKNLVRKDVVDYLVFEGDGGEYDMMSHLAKGGSLEENGITVCQINIEYHLPKNVVDPRKEIFRKHVYQFIRDRKYTLLSATSMGNLRLFWVNTSSMECARRYFERLFSNDVDLG